MYDQPMTEKTTPKPTTTKPQENNTNAPLTYVAGWFTGLIFLLTEKEDEFVRFHAAQSLIVFGAFNLFAFVPLIGWILTPILTPVALVLWIVLMVKAYQGEKFKLPVVGEYAEQLKDKIGK